MAHTPGHTIAPTAAGYPASPESFAPAEYLRKTVHVAMRGGSNQFRTTEINRFGACLVGNQVDNRNHAGVFGAVARTIREYLGLEVPVLALPPALAEIHESVNRRRPLAFDPESEGAAVFRGLAHSLLKTLPDGDDDLEIDEDDAIVHDSVPTDDDPTVEMDTRS